MKKVKRVPILFGLDAFPADLSIEYVKQKKEKHKTDSQEKLLCIARSRVLNSINYAIEHDRDRITFRPTQLDDEHKLLLVQEIMEKFNGRVFGASLTHEEPMWDYKEEHDCYRLLSVPTICSEYIISLQ